MCNFSPSFIEGANFDLMFEPYIGQFLIMKFQFFKENLQI